MEELPIELGWPAYSSYEVEKWTSGKAFTAESDWVAEEVPVALLYNGEPHVVMLASPLDLEDFAIGFSLTENIISSVRELQSLKIYRRAEGIEIRLKIDNERSGSLASEPRNLAGRTGCGLCGTRTIREAVRMPPSVREGVKVELSELAHALSELTGRQTMNRLTGAFHAAAWAVPGKGISLVREDVGRHNALDKLIGAIVKTGINPECGFALVTSRASFEMVQKCAMAGITFMAAISAPTGLAVRRAKETGLTLIAFARENKHVVYSHEQRLIKNNSGVLV